MNKFYFPCQQRYASVWIASLCTIFQIAFYRTTYFRQLTSYLMMSSCHKLHFYKSIIFRMGYNLIFQYSFFGIWHLFVVSITFVLFLITDQPIRQYAL